MQQRLFLVSVLLVLRDVNSEVNNNVVSRYNVNGMRINGAQKGLNIVKLANGKVVKMAVK